MDRIEAARAFRALGGEDGAMNEHEATVKCVQHIVPGVVFIIACITAGCTIYNTTDERVAVQAIQKGLHQQRTTEGRIIWAKP